MKKSLSYFLLLLASTLLCTQAYGQNCDEFLLLNKNTSYEILTYNSKDKLMSKADYLVTDVNNKGNEKEASVHVKVYDNKNKLASEGEYVIGCKDGTISMDMRSMMNPEMMEAYKDMEVSMEGDKMLYPGNLQVGQSLEDGHLTITLKDKSSGQSMSTITMTITDRKVESKENIKVPAGSYASYKISQSSEMENRMMGMRMPGMQIQTVEYYVPAIGVVRSESYRNGKLMSYSIINKINK